MSESVYLRVDKGVLVPADSYAAGQLRTRRFKVGDVLKGKLTKLRNAKFNRLVHRIGQLVVANIDAFQGMDAHTALKRIQLEGNIACEQLALTMPNVGVVMAKVPRSLSFESMDEGECVTLQDPAKPTSRSRAHGLPALRSVRIVTVALVDGMALVRGGKTQR